MARLCGDARRWGHVRRDQGHGQAATRSLRWPAAPRLRRRRRQAWWLTGFALTRVAPRRAA